MPRKKNRKDRTNNKKPNLVSYGVFVLPPVVPGPDIEKLCKNIDDFYSNYPKQHRKQKASDLIKGSFYAMRPECRSNTDWMSQSASSARDALYPLFSEGVSSDNLIKLFKKYAVSQNNKNKQQNGEFTNTFNNLDVIYKRLSDLTHHGTDLRGFTIKQFMNFTESDFENLMRDFTVILGRAFNLQQIYIHTIIDMVAQKKRRSKAMIDDLKLILKVNSDARYYFYSKIDKSWLNWLWQKGFLNAIKEKAGDASKYSYRLPELDYLARMAEKNPHLVGTIILDKNTATREANFNPEVIIRFLWILDTLPLKQVKLLTSKIREENWVYLMRKFNLSITAYDFIKIIKKLVDAKENKALLELAQAVFVIKSAEERTKRGEFSYSDSPFYIQDLTISGIFEATAGVDGEHLEEALKIVTDTMAEILKMSKPFTRSNSFEYEDLYTLYELDFFMVDFGKNKGNSYREDVKSLAITIKKIVERIFGTKCGEPAEAKRLLTDYIKKLPITHSTWRLKLFVLAQCPQVFKDEIKEAFFKIFEVGERYFEVEGGAEYHQALAHGFSVLDPEDQRKYIEKVFTYFDVELEDADLTRIRKLDGAKILCFIREYLTDEQKIIAKQKFGISPDDAKCVPEPAVGKIRSGTVHPRSPVNIEDFTIDQIMDNLKDEWQPAKLKEQFKGDDFLSPRGVEGLGDALREDIKRRVDQYLDKLDSFFDREQIHPHYVYSLLRGIDEMLRNKQTYDENQAAKIINFFDVIKSDGRRDAFKERKDQSWLASWMEVHKLIADILLGILQSKENKEKVHSAHREQIKDVISYLLAIEDPPEKENLDEEPYHVAINSVRGRAYETFVVFVENDGKTLAEDTKEIYKKTLDDKALAVRFVIGRYLASFYFRDKSFVVGILPIIFPKDDPDKKDIYLATWEGYLSNTLYGDLFLQLREYYLYAISISPEDYTKRKYIRGLDESIAAHLALAFAHLNLEMDDELFVQFWGRENVKRHQEFIAFIGRSCLTRDQAGDEWLEKNKVSKDKLLKFWDWALTNVSEPEALSGFGLWVNPNKEILEDAVVAEKMAVTLEKSDGDIEWDYGLLNRLPILAEKNSIATLRAITRYLLNANNELNQNRRAPLLYEEEIKNALRIIFKNGDNDIKQKVTDLINTLIEKGSSMFWGLKDVIES